MVMIMTIYSHRQTSSVYKADKPFYFLQSHFQWSVCKFLIRNWYYFVVCSQRQLGRVEVIALFADSSWVLEEASEYSQAHMCLWSVCVSGHCHQDTFKVMPPDQLAWLAQSVISPPHHHHCSDKYLNIIPHYCVAHCSPSLISQPFRFHFMDNDARRLAQL